VKQVLIHDIALIILDKFQNVFLITSKKEKLSYNIAKDKMKPNKEF